MFVSKLTTRVHLCAIKRQFLFVCLWRWETHLTQDPLAQKNDGPTEKLHVSFFMATRPNNENNNNNKKTTRVPGRTLKSHTAESKTIPTDRHGKNCEKRARKVVRLFGRRTLFSSGETLSGAFSFCGSPLVADPFCLQTLLLRVQSDWI